MKALLFVVATYALARLAASQAASQADAKWHLWVTGGAMLLIFGGCSVGLLAD